MGRKETVVGQAESSQPAVGGVVTSDMYKPHKYGWREPVLGLVVLLLLAGGGYWLWHSHQANSDASKQSAIDPQHDPVTTTQVKATQLAQTDPAAAAKVYDQAISSSTTDTSKFSLYMSKGAMELDAKDYDGALATGLVAEKVHADYRSWGLIAQAYDGKGDKKDAITYYNKAINDPNITYVQGAFQQRVKELSQ